MHVTQAFLALKTNSSPVDNRDEDIFYKQLETQYILVV